MAKQLTGKDGILMRLIDGDALKEAFYQKMKELLKSTDTPQISNEALSLLCGASLITEAPTIEPERKKGVWLLLDGYRCSVCNYKLQTTGIPMDCPNCGADMRGRHG